MADPRELLAKATPRPWQNDKDGDIYGQAVSGRTGFVTFGCGPDPDPMSAADAALIVQAVNEHEVLLDIADDAEALLSSLGPEGITDEYAAGGLERALARLDALRETPA
jgi:hypothetical protein